MSLALFFRLCESSNPRPKGLIEMGSTLITNWATSSVGSESAPHFNKSLWSWVRALTEAKEKGKGHAPIACEWDHPSSEWAKGWGPYSTGSAIDITEPRAQLALSPKSHDLLPPINFQEHFLHNLILNFLSFQVGVRLLFIRGYL